MLAGAALTAQSPPRTAALTDAAFSGFLQARTASEAVAFADRIIESGVGFEEAFARLRRGRVYSRDVPRGVIEGKHRSETGEYFYTLDIPQSYDPARAYQVRVQLHGGVGRLETNTPPRPGSNARLAGAEQIYVMPYAWRDAPWWSGRQIESLRTILDLVKRTYNVDENRVVLSGVSDGGTGAYYMAMRETTPFASFLPLNGFIQVLGNETAEADGDLFPNNLLNKPSFIVNGGRDPIYPASVVDPVVEHMKKGGVDLVYRPQPNAAHDTSWWPEVQGSFERFVADHPRVPLPDTLTWESGPPNIPSRAHWLIIDRIDDQPDKAPSLPDLNRMAARPTPEFGIRGSGARINRVMRDSNAERIGLRPGDVVLTVNNQPVPSGADLDDLLRDYPAGRPLLLTVARNGEPERPVRLSGRYAPTVLAGQSDAMFPRQRESGRVDLVRRGNRVEANSRGVAALTLLLSPDQFDLNRAVMVVVNGRTLVDGMVQRDVRTLLRWAARDNDRTMLFAAELQIAVQR